MRVNILTQPLFVNYGGILQNFALQTVLRKMGYEPLTINVAAGAPGPIAGWKAGIRTVINGYRRLRGGYPYIYLNPNKLRRAVWEGAGSQRQFIERHIRKVDVPGPFGAKVSEKYRAGAWIVGSDQVWRPWCSPYISNCFLDFLGEGDHETRRIAYAASLGTERWEIGPELTEKIIELAKRFDALSVREATAIGLCRDNLGIEPIQTLDPTLLLTAEDYLTTISAASTPSGRYVATYILDSTPQKRRTVAQTSRKLGLRGVGVGDLRREGYDTVESWLATIAGSERVITDSFHGTVFSIIFRKPVKILANDLRGNTRLTSLMEQLPMEEDEAGFMYGTERTYERLRDLREKSLEFLRNAIEGE